MTMVYLVAYQAHPAHPYDGADGWWTWYDQGWYMSAAKAWASGRLDPALHLYLPGYSLLGAVFVPLLALHSFAAVDLLCLLASLWLFSRLAIRLLPDRLPFAGLIGGATFAVASLGTPALREIWVVPWSSTAVVPLTYGTLLVALRGIDSPARPGRMVWVGLLGGAIAMVRPPDSASVLLACGLGIGPALLRRPLRPRLASIGWGALGLACSLGVLVASYLAIYGLNESRYLLNSRSIGFEWRSLPLRWVMLGLDPHPLFSDGRGLVAAFPWLAPGAAALAACLMAPSRRGRLAPHLVVGTATMAHVLVYLTYRDLYPEGLFGYDNYHYYKWVLPVLALYCVILATRLAMSDRRLPFAAVTVALLCVLLPWRVQFTELRAIPREAVADPQHTLRFEDGLSSVDDAVLVTAGGSWAAIYDGHTTLSAGSHPYTDRLDYKLHPAPGGFFLTPLRPLPPGPVRLTVESPVTLDPATTLLHARQTIVFGLPCWLPDILHRCPSEAFLPPPALPPDGMVPVDASGQAFLSGAWSQPEAAGRHTEGDLVMLRLRPPATPQAMQLQMQVSAYDPPGAEPLRIVVSANGHLIDEQRFDGGGPSTITATIPADLDQRLALEISIAIVNPRRPIDHEAASSDTRRLGLLVRSIHLTPVPNRPA